MRDDTRTLAWSGPPEFCAVGNAEALGLEPPLPRLGLALRALVRAREGMQKEALVTSSATGRTWRLASDEGPYLAGTDLAPPPLGLFGAGLVAAYANEIVGRAVAAGLALPRLRLALDTFYSMEGSALRGTMTGGALPPQLAVESDTDEDVLQALANEAVASSPVTGLARGVHESSFTLVHNGRQIDTGRVRQLAGPPAPDPREAFDGLEATTTDARVMAKIREADRVEGEGGVASSLRAEQSRLLHARAVCTIGEDGLKVIDQFLLQPIGSQFRLLSDEDGAAPDAFSYLAAGLGFCFMTQLGRYATITKRQLDRYSVVQDTHFSTSGGPADPVETHVFLDTPDDADSVRQMLDMGEQTCFLHALCRTDVEPRALVAVAR
jgi:OsmC-like protein